MKHPGFVFSFF